METKDFERVKEVAEELCLWMGKQEPHVDVRTGVEVLVMVLSTMITSMAKDEEQIDERAVWVKRRIDQMMVMTRAAGQRFSKARH